MDVGTRVRLGGSRVENFEELTTAFVAHTEARAEHRVWEVVASSERYAIAVYEINSDRHDITVVDKQLGIRGWVPPRYATRPRSKSVREWCEETLDKLERGVIEIHGDVQTSVLWSSDSTLN